MKSLVAEYVASRRPALIDEAELRDLQRHANAVLDRPRPVSRNDLLAVLLETDVEISRALGGLPVDLRGRVHFATPERAAESLLDLLGEYRQATAVGNRERADDCRRAVRRAKDQIRLILRRPSLSSEKRQEKQELLDWFVVWLETPDLFDSWLGLRRGGQKACDKAAG